MEITCQAVEFHGFPFWTFLMETANQAHFEDSHEDMAL
jgi:hypothetical protein